MCPRLAALSAAYLQSVLIKRPRADMSEGECNINVRFSRAVCEPVFALVAVDVSLGTVVAMVAEQIFDRPFERRRKSSLGGWT